MGIRARPREKNRTDPQVLTIEEGNRRRFASGTRFAAKWTPRRRFFARTMADKALLRFSLIITPMRAEGTVISSRTRGIWTDQRDARPPDPPLHRRKRDPRSHGSLAAGVAASSQMVWQLCTKVAVSSMTCKALRTRITLVCPDPPCTTADDSVFGAHWRDYQLDAQQSLDSHRGIPETRTLEKIKGSAALLGEALIDRFSASPKQAACSLSK